MEHVVVPIFVCGSIFIGLPWVVFHYITQWKKSGSLSIEDENLLDELHDLARRLDDRMNTIERIIAADNPGWRPRVVEAEPIEDREIERRADRSRDRRRDH
ncbi:envelope stress response membrane protein PspB [Sphingomonas nostoxanthinifaciens]|uniref:envelope stress response membrane protein PspB n=1 Tax=Sphingomonas nostoxanthinifaciens TaxID=2872652 RepID=UPI001CC20A3D|nr:envelope stress response membrane protein PspB [Sphingomonas nostoxanthinifaciens]UAK26013.1 envelope stress response membrane protein PspB [Sphingomonas nostoxanthinifaciens]